MATTTASGMPRRPGVGEITIAPEEEWAVAVEEEFIGAICGEAPVRLTTLRMVYHMEFTEAVARGAGPGHPPPDE